ncbi:BCCT family transporter [Dehalobacterium formicoaceticum]|uniref:BCCT family transporter n=1 Tax=Dehalobacterium formicoaceticum TaxID=51515 RepID=UPI0031F71ADF
MDQGEHKPVYAKVNYHVFGIAAIACFLFFIPLILMQNAAQGVINQIMYVITHTTDWFFQVVVFGCLVFLAWLAFSRYGKVKLGGPDDKPEFSTFTWVAMMFCGGTGAGIVYWSTVEPIYYLQSPPFWIEPFSPQAAQYALSYGIFHWGFSAWATFALPAVVFAYIYYVRKRPVLTVSYACRGVIGNLADGWLGKLIDAIVVIGLVGGMATALGFIVPMLSTISADYLGIDETLIFKMLVLLAITAVYSWSAYHGLKGGIAKLADFNMYLMFVLLAFVFLVGPTSFMLSLFADNIGVLIHDFVRMSFYTDPITKSGFPQSWTVFYWAWWIAWSMYIGLFGARISKGRTIRAVIFNMLFSTTAACMLFYLIFGGYQVDAILNQGLPVSDILTNQGGPAVVSWFLNALPLKAAVIPFFVFVMVIATATGTDAASFTLANMTCVEVKDGVEPPRWTRLFWAGMICLASAAILLVGGMDVIQLSSVLTAVPILPVMVILAISLVKWLREDFGDIQPLTLDKYSEDHNK